MKKVINITPVWLKALIIGFAITIPTLLLTSGIMTLNFEYGTLPWSLVPIIIVLALFWQLSTGQKLGVIKNSTKRKALSHAHAVKQDKRFWTIAACLALVIMHVSLTYGWLHLSNFEHLQMIQNAEQLNALSPLMAFGIILAVSLPAGIVEEIGFRGYMQTMMTKRYGLWVTTALLALVFTAIHGLPLALYIPYLLVSTGFSLIAHYSGSVKPAVVAHVIIDVLLLSLGYIFRDALMSLVSYNVFVSGITVSFVGGFLVAGSCLGLLLFATVYKLGRREKSEVKRRPQIVF